MKFKIKLNKGYKLKRAELFYFDKNGKICSQKLKNGQKLKIGSAKITSFTVLLKKGKKYGVYRFYSVK